MEPFEIAIIGAVLLVFTAVSRRFEPLPITMPIVFVGAGAALSATGVVEVASELDAVGLLAEITLAVILFSDSTRLSLPRLRQYAGFPARLLTVGLPLTVALGTVVNLLLFGDWPVAEALLLAAVLAPTNAALGSAVVMDPAVPARDRMALNVESGLNDGLVVPVVAVATSLVIDMQRSITSWIGFVAQQIGYGTAIGLTIGLGGITLLRHARNAGWSDGRYEQIANGNGFIAAFVGGLAFGSGGIGTVRHRDAAGDSTTPSSGSSRCSWRSSVRDATAGRSSSSGGSVPGAWRRSSSRSCCSSNSTSCPSAPIDSSGPSH